MDLAKIIDKAQSSSFYLWLLNIGSDKMVPFNKPHGFKILSVDKEEVKTLIPYKRRNFNHIKGLHACAMATLSEYTTGILLLYRLGKQYRIILKTLEMEYHYQGKMDATATFTLSDEWMQQHVFTPLESNDAVMAICEVKIHDRNGNHLTTGKVHWQVKPWDKVRTKTA